MERTVFFKWRLWSKIIDLLIINLVNFITLFLFRVPNSPRQNRLGKRVKDLYNVQTDNAIPETVPLFQQPKGKKTSQESWHLMIQTDWRSQTHRSSFIHWAGANYNKMRTSFEIIIIILQLLCAFSTSATA